MPDTELVLVKCRQLHGVLEQTGPGSESGAWYIGHARVVVFHRVQYREIIHAGGASDQVELIGYGVLNIAVCIAEQLGQLGLDGRESHYPGSNFREQRGSGVLGFKSCAADHLRQRLQFL